MHLQWNFLFFVSYFCVFACCRFMIAEKEVEWSQTWLQLTHSIILSVFCVVLMYQTNFYNLSDNNRYPTSTSEAFAELQALAETRNIDRVQNKLAKLYSDIRTEKSQVLRKEIKNLRKEMLEYEQEYPFLLELRNQSKKCTYSNDRFGFEARKG